MEDDRHPKPELPTSPPQGKRLAILALAAIGVVFGDIGTSPLYAIRECFHGEYGITPTPENILGVLSLVFWALILIVCVKYLTFVLRADNRGEGGIIALTAQMIHNGSPRRRTRVLILVGLFGAALLYGDGMITPAISVLSAVEGIGVANSGFRPAILPITVAILIGLFVLQRRGTRGLGVLFGPVTTIWFLVIAVLGLRSIVAHPQVLAAINPLHGGAFLVRNGSLGFLVFGAVFLVVTGTEALFADLGHFGRRPIRVAWYGLVLPSLLCNYFGQGALLLVAPEAAHNPFYAMAPEWSTIPLVGLATAATIIASQAVISGAFSLTRQAVQLGYLPRLQIVHTSPTEIGQIYVPTVNWLLLLATVGLVLGFRSSSHLAAAYGVAVAATMSIASILFFAVARIRWRWSLWMLVPLVGLFLVVDLTFVAANSSKISHGAWFPLVIAAIMFVVMTTWKKGRTILGKRVYGGLPSIETLIEDLGSDTTLRTIPGQAVFMASSPNVAPPALMNSLRQNRAVHEQVVIVTINTEEVPHVRHDRKADVHSLGRGFWRVIGSYGFMEEPDVPELLQLAKKKGLVLDVKEVVFFLGREQILPARSPMMSSWRSGLFAFLSKTALGATRFYNIPPNQVIEIGAQVEL